MKPDWITCSVVVMFAGFEYVLYVPETQQCVIQLKVHTRRPVQYSPEQDSFEYLAEEQTSALLESWGFAKTLAAASECA